jgi:tetratricopeptide (TPR) repeat protein
VSYWYWLKSVAYLALRQDDQAIEWARKSIAINQNFPRPYGILAAALALTGHEAEARDALQRRNALSPVKSIAALKMTIAPHAGPRVHAMYDRIIEGYRKAGMPEE